MFVPVGTAHGHLQYLEEVGDPARSLLESTLGIHRDARLPEYASRTARQNHALLTWDPAQPAAASGNAVGKVLQHNGVETALPEREHCCGMPKSTQSTCCVLPEKITASLLRDFA